MMRIHLSEKEIQDYALEKINRNKAVDDHILQCEQCRTNVACYELLFSEFKNLPKPTFDFNLTSLILPQLRVQPEPKFSWVYFFVIVFAIIGIVSIGSVFYALSLLQVGIFTVILGLSMTSVYVILPAALGILLFQSIVIYKSYQRKMDALNFY